MPEEEQARLDVTCDHDGTRLRTHIANSIWRAGAVLPTPHMASGGDINEPYRPLGWDGAPRLDDDVRVRRQ